MRLRKLYENVHVLDCGNKEILFSYDTPVAAKVYDKYYRTSKHYSKTTTKHINAWLQDIQAEEINQEFFDFFHIND